MDLNVPKRQINYAKMAFSTSCKLVIKAAKAGKKTLNLVSLQIRQPGLARRLSLGPTSSAEGEEEPRPDGGRRIDLPGQTEPITNFPLVLAKDMAFVYVLECLLSTK